jgi:hypothetical protein
VEGKLKPQEMATPAVNIRWAGKDADIDKFVFALTRSADGLVGGRLYRSDYYGKADTWDDRTNEMTDALDDDDKKHAYVGVVDVHFLKEHPGHMLFQGPGHTHWISEDYGKTYNAVDTPGGTLGYGSEIKIHPTHPDWVLARVRRNECLKDDSAISKWCAFDLFLSEDFARSWKNLTAESKGVIASFWDFEWGATLKRRKEDPFPDQTILATVYESTAKMKGPYPGWDKDMHFVVSTDFFKTKPRNIVPCGNQFEIINDQIYLAAPSDCPLYADGTKRKGAGSSGGGRARTVSLLVSEDEGLSFSEACVPMKWLDKGYNLFETHGGDGAFLIVDHDETDEFQAKAPISVIYNPGPNSTIYSLGMRRNYRRGYVTDFARVEGLPGMYLANQLDGKIFRDPSLLPAKGSYSQFVQTKISMNGGEAWEELAAPEHATYPECSTCRPSDSCKLHLHGPSSWHYGADARPSFYSHKSAPGIVMAVGNTGEYLDEAADTTCTWISPDGGVTWNDVLPSAAIYEVGDHGGIIMMAVHGSTAPTEEVYFSLDTGGCWYTVQMAEAISIQNIRVEPTGDSDTFIVHGQACIASDAHPTCTHDPHSKVPPAGRTYTMDITDLMGPDLPECKDADYEAWSPPRPETCLLGQNYTMRRRKREASCFNSYDFDDNTESKPCPCSLVDTECEFGYEYNSHAHECQKMPDVELNQCRLVQQKKYFESSTHRRLLHEDQCEGIERVIPDTNGAGVPKGGLPKGGGSHSGFARFFLFLLVAGIATIGFGVWWSQYAGDAVKARIEEIVGPAFEAVVGVIGSLILWCREKFSGRSPGSEAQEAYFQPLAGGEDDFSSPEEYGQNGYGLRR